MKKIIFSALAALAFVGVSCSSDDNSSIDGNGGITPPNKVIKNIERIEVAVYEEGDKEIEKHFSLIYSKGDKLKAVEYAELFDDGRVFEYSRGELTQDSNNKLEKVTTSEEIVLIKDLMVYQNSAYKVGKVLKYDKNQNPSELLVYDKEMNQLKINVTYDDKPFFGFHTLRAAGIIDALDGVNLNLASPNVPAELKLAKELLPNNNPITYTYTNAEGRVLDDVKIIYSYDESNYPTKAVLKGTRQMLYRNYVEDKYVNVWESYDYEVVNTYRYKE